MRTQLTVSIQEADKRDLERMCEIMGITVSKLINDSISGYLLAARNSGMLKKKNASAEDLLKLFLEGVKLDPLK